MAADRKGLAGGGGGAVRTTARFGEWAAETSRDWPAACLKEARLCLIDTIGCMLAGSVEPASEKVVTTVAAWGTGEATVLGETRRLPPPFAAFANGTAAHALDYDDVLDPAMAHPSAPLTAALLALAEEEDRSWDECLDAFLVGFEVMARLGEAMNLAHYNNGWHSTLSLGAPATAAAVARLIGLNAAQTASAISLATSMAGGSKQQFGTMAKPIHAGLAAKNGFMAARLAQSGVTAAEEAIDGPWGIVAMTAGEAAPGTRVIDEKLGGEPAISEYGAWRKLYPCCGSTHRPIDALLAMRAEEGLAAEDVVEVEAVVSFAAATNLRYRLPQNVAEARFSLPYCAAAALIDGRVDTRTFTAEAIRRNDVLALAERVTVTRDAALSGTGAVSETPERARVRVTKRGGGMCERIVSVPTGHPQQPLSEDALKTKFLACAARSALAVDAEAIWRAVHGPPGVGRVAEMMRHIQVHH
nr:MmgE/PrpD family protein [Afifella marina]